MPVYTYRREDGSTFDFRQRFFDDPLQACPSTGQAVSRVIQPAGIIFKGSGFYVNDNNKANNSAGANGDSKPEGEAGKSDAKSEKKSDAKTESKAKKPEKAAAAK